MSRTMAAALLVLASAACGDEPSQPAAEATAAPGPAASPACAPVPDLALSQDFADPRDAYGEDSLTFRQLEANFAAAYRKACAEGLLAQAPLVPAGVPHPGTLFLVGAPQANVASIYREGEAQDRPGDMALEYAFIAPDGQLQVPGEDELHEAIYCAAHGASEAEQQASGRCLPD